MCADTAAADQGLLMGGGVNMLDFRGMQNRVGVVLLVVELRLFPADSCVYMQWCHLLPCRTRAQKESLTGAAGGSDLALWPVTPGGTSITL